MALATLNEIRRKVRLMTHSISTDQISDAQLDEYINTFILYDFPEEIKIFSLRTTLTFYTQPNIDTYTTNTTVATDPLYDFKNRYVAVHPPVYVAGVPCNYTQNRSSFYALWPQTATVSELDVYGNGTAGPYAGTVFSGSLSPLLQNSVVFTTSDANGNGLVLVDYPINNITGGLGIPGQVGVPVTTGSINYLTGVYSMSFSAVVPADEPIFIECFRYNPARPISMLFYDNKFIMRPVPDKAYAINIEVDARPTELLATGDIPDEKGWWQYVALGAARKLLQDRMDMDTVQLLDTEFQHQQDLITRKTLNIACNEGTKTIFSQGKIYGMGWSLTNRPY